MTHPLLEAKLRPPPERQLRLARPRLLRVLGEAHTCKLTLLSAPAGYGKSTLLADYAESLPTPTAWLDLDEADNDATRFLTYLLGALEVAGVAPAVPEPGDKDAALTAVLNALLRLDALTLVLEDYHLIHAGAVHETVAALTEHAPPTVHLLLSTRADPPLPLPKWRAQGELAELRAAELRFTQSEARTFLREVMALDLSEREVTALSDRTEGWIAGVQLAALSLRGKADPGAFIATFTGTDRFVLDYLTEEVLNQQSPEVQDFLTLTAILPRLSGSLCDAVTGQRDSQAQLETLERANLFITPLDRERRWYRLHPFFADLLKHRLERARPDLLPELHARASRWFEAHAVPRQDRVAAFLPTPNTPPEVAGTEPLSEREKEVLRLVAVGCSNKEIAKRLGISLNTVKTHTKSVYSKLGVRSRTQASVRAGELKLL